MFNAIYDFLGSVIWFFYRLIGDYTAALFIFTLIMQVILLPLGIKQQKNSVKQASLAPKIMAIRKKYAGRTDQVTQKKMQEETLDLYQRENFNPAGGCLPLLIQFPIVILLYTVVRNPMSHILKYSDDLIEQIKGIITAAAPNASLNTQLDIVHKMSEMGREAFSSLNLSRFPDFTLFGLDLTQAPLSDGKITNWWLLIVPLVTFIAMYGSQVIIRHFTYQSPEVKEQQNSASMKIMNLTMPLFSVYFAAVWPASLGVYWILRNILQTLQQVALAKAIPTPKFTEEDYKAAEREIAGKTPKKKIAPKASDDPNRPKVRSLHYIDADDEEDVPAAESGAGKPGKSGKAGKNGGAKTDGEQNNSSENKEAPESPDVPASEGIVAPAPFKDEHDRPGKTN